MTTEKQSELFGVRMPEKEVNTFMAAFMISWLLYSLIWSGVCLVAWTWLPANAVIGLSFIGSFGPAFLLAKRKVKAAVLKAASRAAKESGSC